ncbi:MAG: hypothetical protein R3326_03165 [Gemmatimonadota bacterium]|nr:hypothetical protein [Gemmatimonadota bacterium]
MIAEVARRELARRNLPEVDGLDRQAALDARARAVAGAFLGLLGWWLEEAEWLEPGTVDGLFQAVASGALEG